MEYRKGTENVVPDALSRLYESEEPAICSFSYEKEVVDPWSSDMSAYVSRVPRKYPRWKIVNGRIYKYTPHYSTIGMIGDDEAWKLVVPAGLRDALMHESHDEPTAGHQGREKTYVEGGE